MIVIFVIDRITEEFIVILKEFYYKLRNIAGIIKEHFSFQIL